eukprot:scaffold1123_cov168-Amphora_coffeaeformis.AAC.7
MTKITTLCMFLLGLLPPEVLGFQINFRTLLPRKATHTSPDEMSLEILSTTNSEDNRNPDIEDLTTSYSRSLHTIEQKKNGKQDASSRTTNRKTQRQKQGKLILVRCGQSEFNANQTFTGWNDPSLTDRGIQECQHVARLLQAEGFEIDTVYTSKLQRAIKSAWIILQELDALFLPVFKTFRLNQRMYGSLQGLSKKATAESLGVDSVQAWRRSLKAKPPKLPESDPSHPIHDRRYRDLPRSVIPSSESLLDCQERARPLWEHSIRPDLQAGKTVLVVAHEDSLKGLMREIDDITDDDTQQLRMPKGVPVVYRFDENMEPVVSGGYPGLNHTSGAFLEKPGRISELLLVQEQWKNDVGFQNQHSEKKRRQATLEASMQQLRRQQNLINEFESKNNPLQHIEDEPIQQLVERWTDDPCEFEDYEFFAAVDEEMVTPTVVPVPTKTPGTNPRQDGPFVVLIRHGRTPHNNLGLFTGWEDPPLADGGVDDARNAGRLLRRHGFEFDVVYTSWLTRAIQTAYYVLDELDSVWLPIVKSWRLNERMYGALTGKSKKMVSNEYGEEQLKKWRRGYTIRPPPTSSYSVNYPGNDERRAKHFQDLPISWRESLARSVEQRKLVLHRKFPKTESLADCMDRSIPFYTKCIKEEAVNHGKRVLITSHENAIRGILMHLCDIPEVAMNQLHLPNGLPLVYNVRGRCISLLDDGSGIDPMEVHDFGPAAKYLFKPCEITDDFYDSMMQGGVSKADKNTNGRLSP